MNFKLNRFCCQGCGCTFQHGTKVIGFLYLLGEFIAYYVFLSSRIFTLAIEENETVLAIPAVNVVLTVGIIGCTIFLLYAAFQDDKPMFLVPWLTVGALATIFRLGQILFVGIVFIEEGVLVACGVALIFGGLLLGALNIYFWLIVYSYFHKLRDNAQVAPSPVPVLVMPCMKIKILLTVFLCHHHPAL